MTTAPRILCDCGTTRLIDVTTGYSYCTHCDRGCDKRGCDTCHKYSTAVSRRITA